jgi:AMP phosphorylase
MDLRARHIDIGTRTPTVLLHSRDAMELGAHPLDRVQIRTDGRTEIGIVEVTDELVEAGEIGVTRPLGHVDGSVGVTLAPQPEAVSVLRKKLDDVELEDYELDRVVRDINDDRLNDVELTAFVTALYTHGLSRSEIHSLTTSMVDVGDTLSWDREVVADKHSIGGVAGNRTTPVVVPIVASAGLTIPKTSSRAVTSAAGTADTMEVFCGVEFGTDEIRSIVRKTGGCMVWGGAVDLSPIDDKMLRVSTPLSLDPPSQIVASVLSKKKSVGSTHVVVDIPYGEGTKVASLSAARELAEEFRAVGTRLDMRLECAITRGAEPIGNGVGPVLEARDVLGVLDGGGPARLRNKALRLAQMVFECCSVDADAETLLDSGRARETFGAIVAAQGGDPDVSRDDLVPGGETATVAADRGGVVTHVDNGLVNRLARHAGAPKDARAGVLLHVRGGEAIDPGDDLYTVHAETTAKLEAARTFARRGEPVRVRGAEESLVERV